jgi:hypothetical protein
MKKAQVLLMAVFLLLLAGSLAAAGEVAQGKCVGFDQKGMIIVIEEYDLQFSKEHPYGSTTGKRSSYMVGDAQIGIAPKQGDILRIAYALKGKDRVAYKVMNVSKQDLKK